MATYNQSWARSCMCGEVSKESVNKNISLLGWVQRVRNIGGIIFLWLRDRSGMVQVVFNQENLSEDIYAMAESLRSEYVIGVRGEVALRDESAINPEMETGEIEVNVSELVIFNAAQTPPIYIEDDAKDNEAVRLKYRYLDLRKPSVQKTLFMRAKIISAIRNYMDSQGFIEVETPILPNPLQRERGISLCQAVYIRVSAMRCLKARRFISSFSWWAVLIGIIR